MAEKAVAHLRVVEDPRAIADELDDDEKTCLREVCIPFGEPAGLPGWEGILRRKLAVSRPDGPWPTFLGRAVQDVLEWRLRDG